MFPITYLSSLSDRFLTILIRFHCHIKILDVHGHLKILTYQQLLTFLTGVYLTVFANSLSEKRVKD